MQSDKMLYCFDPADLGRHWATRRSTPPESLEQLRTSTDLVLAHFTSSVFLESILSEGLMPDAERKRAIDDGLTSDDRSVYLAVRLDRLYLKRAVQHHGGEGVALAVRASRTSLLPDENGISAQATRLPGEEQLLWSLRFGACKHLGPITRERIMGIYTEDGRIWGADLTSRTSQGDKVNA